MEETLPKILRAVAREHPDIAAQYCKDISGEFVPVSFDTLYNIVKDFARSLLDLGVQKGDRIALISDNRKEWLQADFALMSIGAIDVPRGCDATESDLRYILAFSECKIVIAENATQVKKIMGLKDSLPSLKCFIVFDALDSAYEDSVRALGYEVYSFVSLVSKGQGLNKGAAGYIDGFIDKGKGDDLVCLIFTSGTTGTPKGVMLTNTNFIAQLEDLDMRIYMHTGDRALCVLPVWHVFQRLCEYVVINQAAALCYSKPVASVLLADLQKVNPHLIPAVPRIYEALHDGIYHSFRKGPAILNVLFLFFIAIAKLDCRIERYLFRRSGRLHYDFVHFLWVFLAPIWLILYPLRALGDVLIFRKIRAKLGKCYRAGICGGGALPRNIDEFFWAIGTVIAEGYGLTETAPVISVRYISHPIFATVGKPLKGLSVKIVGEDGKEVPQGTIGVLKIKGPTVMKGYYKRPELTAAVIDEEGYFNTGDLALLTLGGEIVLKGRQKDTIVLRGGENIEPAPIEMKLQESRYIATAVVVGQDQRYLAALILPCQEELYDYAKGQGLKYSNIESLCRNEKIRSLYDSEIKALVNAKSGFKLYERVNKFAFITKPFEVGVELSAKQEIMRYKITRIYAKTIKALFK